MAAAALLAFAVVVATILELTTPAVRDWLMRRPLTVGVVAGVVVFLIGLLAVERFIESFEARRWHKPALVALDHYIFSADRALRRVTGRITSLVRDLPDRPVSGARYSTMLQYLVEYDRDCLRGLSDFVRERLDELGVVAMQSAVIVARYPPYAEVVDRIFDEQRRLGRVAERINHLSFVGAGFGGPNDVNSRELAAEWSEAAAQQLQGFIDELHDLRMQSIQATVRVI